MDSIDNWSSSGLTTAGARLAVKNSSHAAESNKQQTACDNEGACAEIRRPASSPPASSPPAWQAMPIQLIDHQSLAAKTSAVRFRGGNAVRVYDEGGTQLILEQSCLVDALDDDLENNTCGQHEPQNDCGKDDENGLLNSSQKIAKGNRAVITIKRTSTATYGLYFLRGLYTLSMAFLMSAVVFVFFIGVLLFLCADVAHHVHDNLADNQIPMALAAFFGTVL